MSPDQKLILLSLLEDCFLKGTKQAEDHFIEMGKPVVLIFERRSILGGMTEFESAPVTSEFAKEAMEMARDYGREIETKS